VFIESVCTDQSTILRQMLWKVRNSGDFKGMPEEEAIRDLQERIRNYEKVYQTVTESEGAFTCGCLAGFTGDGYSAEAGFPLDQQIYEVRNPADGSAYGNAGCSIISPCTAGKCQNGGTCTDLLTESTNLYEFAIYQAAGNAEPYPSAQSFSCACAPGWFGEVCDIDINECDTSETKGPFDGNHRCLGEKAICTNTPGSYTCACVTGTGFVMGNRREDGWEGNGWDPAKEPADPADRLGDPAKYTGCTDVDDCVKYGDRICMNGATCTNGGNGDGSYSCTCTNRWKGIDCDEDLDECDAANCAQNDGSACEAHMCHEDATCYNNPGSWECKCNNGWTGDGNTCIDADDCEPSPCANGGTCTDLGTLKYNCDCVIGWRGDNCGLDWNECTMGIHTCHDDAECLNNDGSFTCKCDVGFSGDGYAVCDNVDDCWVYDVKITNADGSPRTAKPNFPTTQSVCAHMVQNGCKDEALGVFQCTCSFGWTDKNCDVDVNECMNAADNNCDSRATCFNREIPEGSPVGTLGYTCTCNVGFSGGGTQGDCADVDDCVLQGNPCAHGTCQDTGVNSFVCTCDDGWGDLLCDFDKNECIPSGIDTGAVAAHSCNANARCSNVPGSFQCTCNNGFTGDGLDCLDLDDCGSSPCEHGTCINSDIGESYTCECDNGWTDSQCDFDVNECYTAGHNCHEEGRCVNTKGGFYCRCSSGYEGDGYETAHVHTKETAKSMFMERRCEDATGEVVTCQYQPQNTTEKNLHMVPVLVEGYKFLGYFLNTIHAKRDHVHPWEIVGTNAVGCIDLNDCDPMRDGLNEPDNPCYTNPDAEGVSRGTCEDKGQNAFQCNCLIGWNPDPVDGGGCEKDLDECALGTHKCTPEWAECSNTQGSYTCACKPGYYSLSGIGTDCLECVHCKQKEGYKISIGCNVADPAEDPDLEEPKRLEEVCEDVDECTNEVADGQTFANNCNMNAICTNTEGSFTCECDVGAEYWGDGIGCTKCTVCNEAEYMESDCTSSADRVCKYNVPTGLYLVQNDVEGTKKCLRFKNGNEAGDSQYPQLRNWGNGNDDLCGIMPDKATAVAGGYWNDALTEADDAYKWSQVKELVRENSAVFEFTNMGGLHYMIKAKGSHSGTWDCLVIRRNGGVFPSLLGNNDPDTFPERDDANPYCGFPLSSGVSALSTWESKDMAKWEVVPLDGNGPNAVGSYATKFVLKNQAPANANEQGTYLCLYFPKNDGGAGSGYNTNPSRASLVMSGSSDSKWGHKATDAEWCGIDAVMADGTVDGKASLLADKQAVFTLVSLCRLADEANAAGADPPMNLGAPCAQPASVIVGR
jgi:hypothetical protein